jgi:thiol-disulfide isomerase/thioredoxin
MDFIAPIKTITLTVLLFFFLGHAAFAARAMPEFALQSAVDNAKIVNSKELQGKVLLVSFFATWCPPCRQEIPEFIALQKELADKGFSVVGISIDEGGSAAVKKLVELEQINYPVLMANEEVLSGFGGISGIPTSFLINRKGSVVKRYPGYVQHDLVKEDIEQVMKTK